MQILWINILMDGPPAQSLGVEPVDPAVMLRPPRQRDALILTPKLIKRVLTQASIILIGTMCVYVMEMKDGKVTARDTTMVTSLPNLFLRTRSANFRPLRPLCFSICLMR
jgi:P-type Ca2+ transporter type 2C